MSEGEGVAQSLSILRDVVEAVSEHVQEGVLLAAWEVLIKMHNGDAASVSLEPIMQCVTRVEDIERELYGPAARVIDRIRARDRRTMSELGMLEREKDNRDGDDEELIRAVVAVARHMSERMGAAPDSRRVVSVTIEL